MKTIGSFMSALSAVFLGAADACASLSDGRLSSVTSLIDTSQNQAFESQPPAQGLLTADLEPVHSFKLASVQFITGGGNLTFNTPEFPDTSTDNCKRFGYTLTSCSAGNPALFCPYNDKYFKECCDSRYQYDKKDCAYPSTVSGDSCGGKFMCYCDRSLYPAESCAEPMVPSNDVCVESGKKVKEADFEWSPGMDELGNIEISDLDPTKKYEIYTKNYTSDPIKADQIVDLSNT